MVKQAGLLLDVARKFHSAADIWELIGQVKAAGGAYIQLHLSDDENYALESALLGQTADESSKDAAGNYFNAATQKPFLSRAQVRELAVYARSQGIELIPEVGSPAHMGVLFELYGIKYGQQALEGFQNPYSELRYTTDSAIEFVQQIYREVIDSFGNVRRFHIGGDEHGASYNEQYNHEFVAYANRQAAYIKGLGIIPRMWNDGILKSSVNDFDKAIEVTYWSWDGDKPDERERLIGIRASMPDIIRAGHKVINCNSYFTYSAPKGALDQVAHDARYAADDASKRWDLSVWDGQNIPGTEPADPDKVAGAMMSIWCEDISAEQTSAQIRNALQPHFAAVFKIVNAYNNVNAGVPMSNNPIIMHKPVSRLPDVLEPNAVYFLRVGDGIDICVTDMTGQIAHRHNKGGGAALSPEQAAALQRFTSQVGTGATMTLANVTDVAQTTVGSTVQRLEIASYANNSGHGGGSFVRVANSTAADAGMVLKSRDGQTFQRDLSVDDYLTPYMFGYTDGLADATAHFQTVLAKAAKYKCRVKLPRNGLMPVGGGILSIPAGIKEIHGNNCTVRRTTPGNNEMYLAGGDIYIHRLNIDYIDSVSRSGGIFSTSSVSNVEIAFCMIKTKANHGILNRGSRKSGRSTTGWHIHHNDIDSDRDIDYNNDTDFISGKGAYQCILFDLDSLEDGLPNTLMDGLWRSIHRVPEANGVRHRFAKIHHNRLRRGRYGVGLYYTEESEVYQNDIDDVVRGVSLQDRTRKNFVHHNNITNYTTGVLNNYMCEGNVIVYNILKRTADWHFRGSGQAHIAAWVQPKDITVAHNYCEAKSFAGPSWGIAFGVNASGCVAHGNTIVGKIGRSVFNVESSWGGTSDNSVGYGTSDAAWSTTDTKDNVFMGNHIDVNTPCVLMAVISGNDNATVRKAIGTVFKDNIIKGDSGNARKMFQTIQKSAGGIEGTVVEGNIYMVDAPASKFDMGNAAMYARLSAEVGRPAVAFEASGGGASANVSFIQAELAALRKLALNQSDSVTMQPDGVITVNQAAASYALRNLADPQTNNILKHINGGVFGQEITIQFQNGYQVEHSDFLRLQPAQSVTSGLNGNSFIRFKCIDPTQQKWVQLKY